MPMSHSIDEFIDFFLTIHCFLKHRDLSTTWESGFQK